MKKVFKVFLSIPLSSDYADVLFVIKSALIQLSQEDETRYVIFQTVEELNDLVKDQPEIKKVSSFYDLVEMADIIIVDLNVARPNLMYELGYFHATKKCLYVFWKKVVLLFLKFTIV